MKITNLLSKICFYWLILQIDASPVQAADVIIGSELSLWWAGPFIGLLLSLALGPVFLPQLWPQHYGKIGGLWSLCTVGALISSYNFSFTTVVLVETLVSHYLPFIILLTTLYIMSSGIHIELNAPPRPIVNVIILTTGMLSANIIGTIGAALLFIQPLLSVNRLRLYKTHTIIFYIFLVCNMGGCLTPLGDPPLFLGFLQGVSFFWVTKNLLVPMLIVAAPLLIIYTAMDSWFYYREKGYASTNPRSFSLAIFGKQQFLYIGLMMGVIIINAIWPLSTRLSLSDSVAFYVKDIIRDFCLLGLALVSYKTRDPAIYAKNNFYWHPLIEIAKLFAAIFITAVPIIAILKAGQQGALSVVANHVTNYLGEPVAYAYFWLCGFLSAFLDNAPTYLIFFNIAGGDATTLMTKYPLVLIAISCGAVFMGALSYIGNAPNFMIKAIAERERIRMPSFFGYLVWSICLLLPLFGLLSYCMF